MKLSLVKSHDQMLHYYFIPLSIHMTYSQKRLITRTIRPIVKQKKHVCTFLLSMKKCYEKVNNMYFLFELKLVLKIEFFFWMHIQCTHWHSTLNKTSSSLIFHFLKELSIAAPTAHVNNTTTTTTTTPSRQQLACHAQIPQGKHVLLPHNVQQRGLRSLNPAQPVHHHHQQQHPRDPKRPRHLHQLQPEMVNLGLITI